MAYELLRFERDPLSIETKYVALIEQEGFEGQPFRVLIENSKTVEEALADVTSWIQSRVAEDVAREQEKTSIESSSKECEFLNQLNASV